MDHSAANTLLALVQLQGQGPGTEIMWAIRGRSPARLYGGGDADGLPARGLLGSDLRGAVQDGAIRLVRDAAITELSPEQDGGGLTVSGRTGGAPMVLTVDSLVAATGSAPTSRSSARSAWTSPPRWRRPPVSRR